MPQFVCHILPLFYQDFLQCFSFLALCCKLLRVLFAIGKKQCPFDGNKLLRGLPQIESLQAA
ncbi:hypothetical protein FHP05_15195 [Cerasibacillus terrae]|uniref:Uncharacterized protein n=1 Tax=Cerasibacillus terrae TaxID=2498845 RepID=A0A5C8NFV4_9BACI|nr:hypothetical protein FHP05_15195 [Cerasibacillus terrae]